MAMTTYRVTCSDGQTFAMRADTIHDTAAIGVNWSGEADSWVWIPYRTADAGFDAHRAAALCVKYGADPDDQPDVVSVVAEGES